MKLLKQVSLTRNLKKHDIDTFIKFLKDQKEKGATILQFHEVRDPHFDCGWISTSRVKSKLELTMENNKEFPKATEKRKKGKRILDIAL